jgi:Ca-activated chloride channel homolog
MHKGTALLGLLLLATPMVAQAASYTTQVAQVDLGRYPTVTLYVRVADEVGNAVGGLTRDAFALREDGVPVEISDFAGAGGPVSAALVIDQSGSMNGAGKLAGAQTAAQTFVAAMRPNDRTALIGFAEQTRMVQPFTNDQAALSAAIGHLDADGGTALYDAVVKGVDALKGENGRRALIVLTDGQDCRVIGCDDFNGSRNSLEEAIGYARAAGQPVYVIGLGEKNGGREDGIDEGVLRRIGRESDGEYFYAPDADALAALYARLAGGLHAEYRLRYVSPRPFYDGTRRQIDVAVAGGATANSSYIERHLIDVRSHPLVGLGLLVPVLAALMLPTLLGRAQRSVTLPGSQSGSFATASPLPTGAPRTAQPIQIITLDEGRCAHCAEPLRPSSRFCPRCGRKRS